MKSILLLCLCFTLFLFNPFLIYSARQFSSISVDEKTKKGIIGQDLLFLYEPDPEVWNAGYFVIYKAYTDKKQIILNQKAWCDFYQCIITYFSYVHRDFKKSVLMGTVEATYEEKEIKIKVYFYRGKIYDKAVLLIIPGAGEFYIRGYIAPRLSVIFSPMEIGEVDAQLRKKNNKRNPE